MATQEDTVHPARESPMDLSDQPSKISAKEKTTCGITCGGSYKLGWSGRRVETYEVGLNLIGKKLWGLVNGSVSQPRPERPIEAASLGFDIPTIMTYVLGEVEHDQIQQLFVFPLLKPSGTSSFPSGQRL